MKKKSTSGYIQLCLLGVYSLFFFSCLHDFHYGKLAHKIKKKEREREQWDIKVFNQKWTFTLIFGQVFNSSLIKSFLPFFHLPFKINCIQICDGVSFLCHVILWLYHLISYFSFLYFLNIYPYPGSLYKMFKKFL